MYFFHYSSKHFAFNTIILFTKKQLIWVFEWRKSVHYWWSYILFSPERKELTSMPDPLLYRWGVPPVVIRCVHWTMQMWVLQTWNKAQGLAILMSCIILLKFINHMWYLIENALRFRKTATSIVNIRWPHVIDWYEKKSYLPSSNS